MMVYGPFQSLNARIVVSQMAAVAVSPAPLTLYHHLPCRCEAENRGYMLYSASIVRYAV